jgi:carbonic anhydrase/acetyltransferase-like protein (isoleucine patch superfamily)
MVEILIKRSLTAGAEPTSLAVGELAVNITDKKVWIGGNAGPVLLNDGEALLGYLPLAGGEMTGAIYMPTVGESLIWDNGGTVTEIASDGGTITFYANGAPVFEINSGAIAAQADIWLPNQPTEPFHAVRKDYVDDTIAALSIPTPQPDKLGGVFAAEAEPGFVQYGVSTSGAPIFKEIAVPPAKSSVLGGIYANVPVINPGNEFVRGVDENGQLLFGNVIFPPAAEPYVLPTASATVLGGVKIGANLSIDANGVLSAPAPGTNYTLPTASATVLGGIKIGNGLSIDASGVVSASASGAYLPLAGGTMTGAIKLPADPVNALEAATKQYVDGFTSTAYVRKTGDVMSGPLRFSPSSYSAGYNGTDAYFYMDTAYVRMIVPSGKQAYVIDPQTAVMQFLSAAPQTAFTPTVDNDLTHKKYVDKMLPLAGGTMTGTITMPSNVAGFQFGATGYNVFGGSGGVAVRSNTTNIVTFTGANVTNFVPLITPATGVGVQFGVSGATLSRGSAATKIAASGAIELPTTAPAAGEAVRRDYVDGRVIAQAAGGAAPATTGLSAGTLWVEY